MTNQEIMMRLDLVRQLGNVRGKLGWYVYRNIKVLAAACAEAVKIRDDAVIKYGTKDGENVYSINPESKRWQEYVAEVEPVMKIEQNVKLEKISREEFDVLAKDTDLSATELTILDELIVEDRK